METGWLGEHGVVGGGIVTVCFLCGLRGARRAGGLMPLSRAFNGQRGFLRREIFAAPSRSAVLM